MPLDGIDTTVQPFYVTPDMVPVWAERIRPHLVRIGNNSDDRYDANDLLTFLLRGQMQLWLAVQGVDLLCVMLTEVHTYPKKRALRIVSLVGRRPLLWRKMLPRVEAAAKQHFGCTVMEATPRAGQMALLPGYAVSHLFVEKAID